MKDPGLGHHTSRRNPVAVGSASATTSDLPSEDTGRLEVPKATALGDCHSGGGFKPLWRSSTAARARMTPRSPRRQAATGSSLILAMTCIG